MAIVDTDKTLYRHILTAFSQISFLLIEATPRSIFFCCLLVKMIINSATIRNILINFRTDIDTYKL